ncbi:class I lanthipeptide [Lacinutrix sp. Hel_I_90]|uniref:class I lanthipeptide n=1 Tax=Lacinutrix sp. Hel_I_90 TaxID=1249999 RepID=UPI0005C88654|nr:class I lanthipeptide [Lacinutrix sp. Hel_I_90]
MKTQKTELQFGKSSITELNDNQTKAVNGGCQWSQSSGPTLTLNISIIKDPTPTIDFEIN